MHQLNFALAACLSGEAWFCRPNFPRLKVTPRRPTATDRFGKKGRASSPLRLAGTAEIEGERVQLI